MKNIIIYIYLSIFFSCTCSKDNSNEQVKPLWKSFEIYDKADFNNGYKFHGFREKPVFKNTIVVSGYKNSQARFYGLDINNGELKWDLLHLVNNSEIYLLQAPCIKDNYWYFGDGDKLYRVNMNNGEKEFVTIQINNYRLGKDMVAINNYLFNLCERGDKIYYGNEFNAINFKFIPDVKHQTKYPFFNNQDYYFFYYQPKSFINYNNDVCLLIPFVDVDENDNKKSNNKISLFNVSKEKFVYDGIDVLKQSELKTTNLPLDSLLVRAFSLSESNANLVVLYCININTGALIWKVDMPSQGKANVIGDKIYYTTPLGKIYLYNIRDGKLLTQKSSEANAASNMIKYNGVIYYVEEGSRIRAIDAETGEYLMKISNTPDAKPFDIWSSSIAVVNGKIIVDNYKNVYAYPTIR